MIGGYTPGPHGFDAIIVGYYDRADLRFVAKIRSGFTPDTRRKIFRELKGLFIDKCPFVNLPETERGRWGAGLDAKAVKECRWLKPKLVAQIDFLEWTGKDHLRHAKFVRMRDDKRDKDVRKE